MQLMGGGSDSHMLALCSPRAKLKEAMALQDVSLHVMLHLLPADMLFLLLTMDNDWEDYWEFSCRHQHHHHHLHISDDV